MNLTFPQDQRFKTVLIEALNAPLPDNWQAFQVDGEDQIVYKNKVTQQIKYEHPLDQFYRQKIQKMKLLMNNLTIQTIPEERQSWMKDSSQMYRHSQNSKQSPNYSMKQDNFINEIQEEKSVYDDEQILSLSKNQNADSFRSGNHKIIIVQKGTRTPRRYRKRKQKQIPTLQQLSQELMNMNILPTLSIKQINEGKYPILETVQQNQKLRAVIKIQQKIQQRKAKLKQLQMQKKKKTEYLEILKKQLTIITK